MFNVIYCFLCKRKRSFAGYIGNVLMKYALQLKWVAPTGQDARAQQGRGERSQPLHVAQRGHSNPAATPQQILHDMEQRPENRHVGAVVGAAPTGAWWRSRGVCRLRMWRQAPRSGVCSNPRASNASNSRTSRELSSGGECGRAQSARSPRRVAQREIGAQII